MPSITFNDIRPLLDAAERMAEAFPQSPDATVLVTESRLLRKKHGREDSALRLGLAWAKAAGVEVKRFSEHTAYADFLATVDVETEQEALEIFNRLALVPTVNSEKYRATFQPLARLNVNKSGEAVDAAPWFCKVDGFMCEFRAYVDAGAGAIGDVSVRIGKPEIRATARRVEFRGGFRYEDRRVVDPAGRFKNKLSVWSPKDSVGSWVLY